MERQEEVLKAQKAQSMGKAADRSYHCQLVTIMLRSINYMGHRSAFARTYRLVQRGEVQKLWGQEAFEKDSAALGCGGDDAKRSCLISSGAILNWSTEK